MRSVRWDDDPTRTALPPYGGGFSDRLEHPFDLAIVVDEDTVRRRRPWQSRHRHDVTGNSDNELGTGRQSNFTDRNRKPSRRTPKRCVRREAILRFRHADGEMAVPLLEVFKLAPDFFVSNNVLGSINILGDMLSLIPQGHGILIQGFKIRYRI